MSGRDALSPAGARAPSQSPLRASSSSAGSAADRERERQERQERLAAWREQRQHQQQPATPPKKPTTPTKPKPFRASASSGPSDEEKQLILQRRRELMRTPMRPLPLPQRPKQPDAPRAPPPSTPTSSAASAASASDAREYGAPPTPRTPPRRGAHQDVHRLSRPPPPQTPPLAPRPRSSSAARSTRRPFEHGQHSQRSSLLDAVATADEENVPALSLSQLSIGQPNPAQQDADEAMLSPTLQPVESPRELDIASFPALTSHIEPTTSQDLPQSDDGAVSPKMDLLDLLVDAPSETLTELSLLQPSVESPRLRFEPRSEEGTSAISPSRSSVEASPRKQVRFAVENDARANAEQDCHVSVEDADAQGTANSTDAALSISDVAPGHPLTESLSSIEREMEDREQLMSDVDELIHRRTANTIVTDQLLHRRTEEDGHEEIDETVVTSHSHETTHTRTVEESVTDEPTNSPCVDAMTNVNAEDASAGRSTRNEAPSESGERGDAAGIMAVGASRSTPQDNGNEPSNSGAKLRVVKAPNARDASEGLSTSVPPPVASMVLSTRRVAFLRSSVVVILLAISVVAFDILFPQSPVSRGLRVSKRVSLGLMSYLGSRTTVWLWRTLIQPGSRKLCELVVTTNLWLEPRAKALRSLVNFGHGGVSSAVGHVLWEHFKESKYCVHSAFDGIKDFHRDPGNIGLHAVKLTFERISSSIADALLFVCASLMRPLPSIEPESTAAAQNRLQQLTDAQRQLRLKVKDLLRTQEEWALQELEKMKERRVAYATATKEILAETTRVMLKAVQEAKLSAAEHIQDFTNELAHELMASIQPELEEYERLEADITREQADQDAALGQVKLKESARLEVLRVESAKRQAASKLDRETANDRKTVLQDKIFVEVDVMEVVETVEEVMKGDVGGATKAVADSFEDTVGDVKAIVETANADLDAVIQVAENVIERAEKQFIDDAVVALAERERELTREHDAAQAEIARLTTVELKRLENERHAAEELARATALAEEAVKLEAEEAQYALDVQLEAGMMELELEAASAASIAVKVEEIEVERVVVEEQVIKEVIDASVIDEAEQMARSIGLVEGDTLTEVEEAEFKLTELVDVADSSLDRLAVEAVQRLESEQAAAMTELDAVATTAEREVAASAGIVLPQEGLSSDSSTNVMGFVSSKVTAGVAPLKSIIEESERRHMVMLSVGFAVLALVTAYVLYPRWRRLIANPTSEEKAMSISARRRRRSWQRPAQVSDSEPEEVMLLQTGSSSDDGLSDTNEPEPEVVEMMSGVDTPQASFSRSTRTSYTTYSRSLEFSRQTEQANEDDDEAEEELVTPPPRRALRRRRH